MLQQTKHMLCAYAQRRRPRRPPFLRVESEGVGVTSSIRPMRMPARARARRADWAPGPGVLVPLPPVARILTWRAEMPSSLQRAAGVLISMAVSSIQDFCVRTDVLGSQHSGVGGGLVTVGLDLHATGDTRDGFAARQIGDVDEGVVERGEDAGNAEDELALTDLGTKLRAVSTYVLLRLRMQSQFIAAYLDVLRSTALDLLLGRHVGCILVTG